MTELVWRPGVGPKASACASDRGVTDSTLKSYESSEEVTYSIPSLASAVASK